MPVFRTTRRACLALAILLLACLPLQGADFVLVDADAQPKPVQIYVPADTPDASAISYAANDLAEAITAMTGVEATIVKHPADQALPAEARVVLGALAVTAGAAPQDTSLWQDHWRIIVSPERLLVGGESDAAVNDGVMTLLHEWGVRYLLPRNIPGDPGTIFPTTKKLALSERDVEARPHVRSRRLWGHNVGRQDPGDRTSHGYIRRNGGLSAVQLQTSHAWSHLLTAEQNAPEYRAIKRFNPDGTPVRSKQFCVSNADVPPLVAGNIIDRFAADPSLLSQSISPNDGGGACICLSCQALDVPGYLEPSSGNPVLSDRYIYFYNAIAERVAAEYPGRFLPFFVYSDYSRPPRRETDLHPMLVPVFGPIRYPRMHGLTNRLSEQNLRLRREMQAYGEMAKQIGYYGYNYNLAETTVPFSKVSIYSTDLPWMSSLNLTYISMETLGNWNTLAPTIYLSARYPFSGEDPAAIMDDFYTQLGGAAAPQLRAYWEDVDAAFAQSEVQAGAHFGIERIVTPARIATWDRLLADAAQAAQTDREKQVVALFQTGVEQAKLFTSIIRHLYALEIEAAMQEREAFVALNTQLEEQNIVSIYPNRYFNWFLNHVLQDADNILTSGGQIVQKLPNTWHYRPDFYDQGVEEEWQAPDNLLSRWRPVQTWGAPSLYEQGQGDWKGYQWFRITVDAPADTTNLMLWFGGNDGTTRIWINGKAAPIPVTRTDKKTKETSTEWLAEHTRSWRAFSVPVADLVTPGEPVTITIRIDHSLNELNLGGIIRPVMFYRAGDTPPKPTIDTYQRIDM